MADSYINPEKGIAFFDGIAIETDPITSSLEERVLVILEEEQVFMCRQMLPLLEARPGALVLDIGTGSGVFAIFAAKQGCKVIAVDISPRAINTAKRNAEKINQVKVVNDINDLTDGTIFFVLGKFDQDFASQAGNQFGLSFDNQFDIVILAPPYNPTCPGVFPALHAASGEDGQKAFVEQIELVPSLLKEDTGVCVGNQMTIARGGKIKALSQIQENFEKSNRQCSIKYVRILSNDYPVKEFLISQYSSYIDASRALLPLDSGVPSKEVVETYIDKVSRENEKFALIYYEAHVSTQNSVEEILPCFIPTKDWADRIWLHKNIVEHASSSGNIRIPSLFLSDFPYPFLVNSFTSQDREIQESRIKLIAGLIDNFNLLDELDLIFLDTAPIYRILGGHEVLPEECHVWLSSKLDQLQLKEPLLKEWYMNIICQHKSAIAPFHHPVFTGAIAPGNWANLMYSYYSKQVKSCHPSGYFQYDQEDHELQQIYTAWVETQTWSNGNNKMEVESKYDDYFQDINLEYASHGYLRATLGHLNVPPVDDYYEDLKQRIQRIFVENGDLLQIYNCSFLKEYKYDLFQALQDPSLGLKLKSNIIRLLNDDFKQCTWTMHKQIDKRFSDLTKLAGIQPRFSCLLSVPLSLKTQPFLDRKAENQIFNIPSTYHGGVWLYVLTQKETLSGHIQRSIFDLVKFIWLLYLDQYTIDTVNEIKPIARAEILHQLPKDLAGWNSHLSKFKEELDRFSQHHPELDVPNFSMPDSMGVMLMFAEAANNRRLLEYPESCSRLLYGLITEAIILQFVDRVVWQAAQSRVLSSPEVRKRRESGQLKWQGVVEMQRRFPKPKLIVKEPFKLVEPQGVYPLLLLALRSAYQHSYLPILLESFPYEGKVEIEYKYINNLYEEIIVTNTGLPPKQGTELSQLGWQRDLNIFKDLTGNWRVFNHSKGRCHYSIYDRERHCWITKIIFGELS